MAAILCFACRSQKANNCAILSRAYDDVIGIKYAKVFIVNSTVKFKMDDEDAFLSAIKPDLNKKLWKNVKIDTGSFKINCFSDSLLISKEKIDVILKEKIGFASDIDSNLTKFIDEKEKDIFAIQDLEQRHKMLNELSSTDQFRQYSMSNDYLSPRVVIFSNPLFVNKTHFLVKVTVVRQYRDDQYSYACLYESVNEKLVLLQRILL